MISSASKTVDLANTRVGSVLVSAAVIDDVVGLVMSRFVFRVKPLHPLQLTLAQCHP